VSNLAEWADETVPPMAALALAVLGVSTSAVLVRFSNASSSVVAFYRVLFTLALVAPFALRGQRQAFQQISGRDWLVALGTGLALAIHFVVWFESLAWTSVAASATLVQTQPIFVAMGAVALLGERVDRRTVLGIVIALAGATMLSVTQQGDALPTGGDAVLGNVLAIAGGVMGAAYLLAGRSLRQRLSTVPYVTIVYATCACVLLLVVIARGHPLFGYPAVEWGLFAAMAIGPGLAGHTVVNWALEHVESTVVSVTLLGEPVGATLLAVLLLGEVPTVQVVGGGLVVLLGIAVTSVSREQSEPEQTEATAEHVVE
jgi:drug/metabolite transporter (DMT)-like permease